MQKPLNPRMDGSIERAPEYLASLLDIPENAHPVKRYVYQT